MKKRVNQLTFWIVGAIYVCYSVGLVQKTGLYPSINTSAKHNHNMTKIARRGRPGYDRFGTGSKLNLKSWVKVNDTDLLTANGGINKSEVKSIRTDVKKRFKREGHDMYYDDDEKKNTKRKERKVGFECVELENEHVITGVKEKVTDCILFCWEKERDWALLQATACSCIKKNEKYTVVELSKCNIRCKKDKKQYCGGEGLYSKYKTDYYETPPFNKGTDLEVNKARMGCYEMFKKNKFRIKNLKTKRLTPRMCLEFCLYYRSAYAVLRGEYCGCYNYEPTGYFKPTKYKCNQDCKGDKLWTCGGYRKNIYDMYRTGFKIFHPKQKLDDRFEILRWAKPRSNLWEGEFRSNVNEKKKKTDDEYDDEDTDTDTNKKKDGKTKNAMQLQNQTDKDVIYMGVGFVIFLIIVVKCCNCISAQKKKRAQKEKQEERKQLLQQKRKEKEKRDREAAEAAEAEAKEAEAAAEAAAEAQAAAYFANFRR